jgi:hypothetical protein
MNKFLTVAVLIFCIEFTSCELNLKDKTSSKWIMPCGITSDCQFALNLCNYLKCPSKEDCLKCFQDYFSNCNECISEIYADEEFLIDGEYHITCDSSNNFQIHACQLLCRSKNYKYHKCGELILVPVYDTEIPFCKCSNTSFSVQT